MYEKKETHTESGQCALFALRRSRASSSSYPQRKLRVWKQPGLKPKGWEPGHMVDLVLNNAPIIVDISPWSIDLSSNHVALVIDLIATIAAVILVVPQVQPLVAGIALIGPQRKGIRGASPAIALNNSLRIHLRGDISALVGDQIPYIGAIILAIACVHPLVAIIALVSPLVDRRFLEHIPPDQLGVLLMGAQPGARPSQPWKWLKRWASMFCSESRQQREQWI